MYHPLQPSSILSTKVFFDQMLIIVFFVFFVHPYYQQEVTIINASENIVYTHYTTMA